MKLTTLLLIVGSIVLLFFVYRHFQYHGVEGFFAGAGSLSISWQPQQNYPDPQNLTYVWTACSASACSTEDSPDKWGTPINTVSTPTATLNDSNCNQCDYNRDILFAVKTVDTASKLESPWTITSINFALESLVEQVYLGDINGNPLQLGATNFNYYVMLRQPKIQTTDVYSLTANVYRGSNVYTLGPVTMQGVNANSSGAKYNGSFSTGTEWTPSPPGPLQNGDLINVTSLLASSAVDGQIYYYGTTIATIKAETPQPPTNITWKI
jgi:hypothetical protein